MRKLLFIATLAFLVSSCNKNQSEATKEIQYTSEELATYREDGLKLAMATKATLGKNLQTAIKTEGTEHALDFCNIKAIPLTDSMSVELNASISRVSDQPRNPDNRANEKEEEIINSIKTKLANGEEPKPFMVTSGNKVIGYYPIITNELCMQCHGGENAEIKDATLAKIQALYPTDEATGYGIGQIRGLFKIEMDGKE